ncbi:hypothetical protein SAMN02745166_03512 [Prosthecobacter debontii]|uniref:Uncharacterized protein n=1 Tax=Prosthecobacter debontii TaxID=48467 RepID=A0A1T4YJM4_9BACT|nr:hypothetical protein SAMN02745166_03512 [Prosthecobacter debontii]
MQGGFKSPSKFSHLQTPPITDTSLHPLFGIVLLSSVMFFIFRLLGSQTCLTA